MRLTLLAAALAALTPLTGAHAADYVSDYPETLAGSWYVTQYGELQCAAYVLGGSGINAAVITSHMAEERLANGKIPVFVTLAVSSKDWRDFEGKYGDWAPLSFTFPEDTVSEDEHVYHGMGKFGEILFPSPGSLGWGYMATVANLHDGTFDADEIHAQSLGMLQDIVERGYFELRFGDTPGYLTINFNRWELVWPELQKCVTSWRPA